MDNIERIYVAGSMTGQENFGFAAFFTLADQLTAAGYHVENPADNDGPTLEISLAKALENHGKDGFNWEDYMKRDIPRVLSCNAICVLPNWRQSRGARWEVDIARKLKMPVLRWNGYKLVPLVEIIGISGYATAGKDEAAKLLAPYGYERRAFADILRTALYELNPAVSIVKDFYEDSFNDFYRLGRLKDVVDKDGWQKAKVDSQEIRELLQRMGTEVGRNLIGENTWVDAAFNTLEDGHKYVFTDMRFPNEFDAVREYNGTTIRLSRPGVGPINNHPSETGLDNHTFDHYIDNKGTKEDLLKNLLEVL